MPKDCQGDVDEPDFWTKYAMVRMGLTSDEVTPEIRAKAKMFGFGEIYGRST
jgi:DNA polymerase I-like protein with 3'-5' exonuclease and polymerase domains